MKFNAIAFDVLTVLVDSWTFWAKVAGSDELNHPPGENRLSLFVAKLGWSRATYAEFVTDERVDTLVEAHENAFFALGGMRRECCTTICALWFWSGTATVAADAASIPDFSTSLVTTVSGQPIRRAVPGDREATGTGRRRHIPKAVNPADHPLLELLMKFYNLIERPNLRWRKYPRLLRAATLRDYAFCLMGLCPKHAMNM